jgi:hypothetical protein
MRNLLAKLALLAIFLSSPFALKAQQDSSAMTGVVTDATGAALPGVTVTLTNPLKGTSFTETTDSKGTYRFSNVPPTEGYVVSFAHDGFSTSKVSDLTLNVGVTRTQDAKLVAGQHETVEVSAGSQEVTLNTTDATIGNNIDVEQLNQLPVQSRIGGITTLFNLQPGVGSGGAVTGARIDQTEVTVDGIDVNDIAAGTTFAIIGNAPVDSVEQFTGTVAGLTPTIGTGSGGQFQLVTKSGTNNFHGNLNEYHQDTSTRSNTWFNDNTGLRRTPLIQNQFGGNIGGPIRIPHVYNGKDKLFFFFNLEDSRIIQSSTAEQTVPLDSFRAGNLSYINNGTGCGASSRENTTPACISTLSPTQIAALDPSHIGFNANVLSYINGRYPHVNDLNSGDGVNTGGFRFTYPTPDITTNYVARIDYNLTPTQRVFFRLTMNRRNALESAPEFPTDPVTHPFIDRSYGYVISHIWTIGQNKVNQFYYGDNISKLDFPDNYNPTGAAQYSFSGLSGPYTSFDGQKRRVPIPVIRDDFNWTRGAHNIAIGGTFKFIKTNSNLINNFNFVGLGLQGNALSGGLDDNPNDPNVRPADINSSTVATGDYDSLFATGLGVVGTISSNFNYANNGSAIPQGGGGPRAYRYFETEAYVSDSWKVNKQLTLTFGLRYQVYSVPYEAHGDESVETPYTLANFFSARQVQSANGITGNNSLPFYSVMLGGKVNHGPNLYKQADLDLAPRFAFAYNPSWSRKTVINGGAGIVYDRTVINAINFLQDQISYLFSNTNVNQFGSTSANKSLAADTRVGANLSYPSSLNPAPTAITSPLVPYVDSTGTPFGLAAGQTNFVINPDLKDPYSIAINFGIQQQIPGHMVLKANYVGRLGRRLLADADGGQVLDFPDLQSGQMMSQAFTQVENQVRAGVHTNSLTAQPWFEHVLAPGMGKSVGFSSNTALAAAMAGTYINKGDMSDALANIAFYTYYEGYTGFLPSNVGITSQFGSNAYLTNQGNSNYHGLLLTLDKNLSQGLRFDVNYTFSHSIDNTSLSANNNSLFSNSGFICDLTKPRACRGNSDFDVRQSTNANVTYDLPFGHGRRFAAATPRWEDEVIGGWAISGIPSYRVGVATQVLSDAFLASFDNFDPAIWTGTNKADLKASINKDATGVVHQFAGGVAGAAKVVAEFASPTGIQYGQRNLLRGPGDFNLDAGLAKAFPLIGDKVKLNFRADAFNVLNHPSFSSGALNSYNNLGTFGKIGSTTSGVRVAQFSLRLDF